MRLSKAEKVLAEVSLEDLRWIESLALARGGFTLRDYAFHAGIRVQSAHARLRRARFITLFKAISPYPQRTCPHIHVLRQAYGRIFQPSYREPQTTHALLDALLRYRVARDLEEIRGWSHHVFQPAVCVAASGTHVVDCLDRASATVLKLATETESGEGNVTLHVGRALRLQQMQLLLRTRGRQDATQQDVTPLTWDDLLPGKQRRVLASAPKSLATNIELRSHADRVFALGGAS